MNTSKNKSNFRFSSPSLIESIFIENTNYQNLSSVKSISFSIESSATQPQNNKDGFVSTVILSVFTDKDINLSDETPCFLRVTMKADFLWKTGEYSAEEINSLLKINAPSLLLSYIRPIISSLTEKSDLPVQHIPFIDFSHNN